MVKNRKGSAKLNRETGTERHLQPLDVFSGLLVRPKCICMWLTTLPRPFLACCPLTKNFFPTVGLCLKFHDFPLDKFLAMPMGSVSNQNCCKEFCFKDKVEKH